MNEIRLIRPFTEATTDILHTISNTFRFKHTQSAQKMKPGTIIKVVILQRIMSSTKITHIDWILNKQKKLTVKSDKIVDCAKNQTAGKRQRWEQSSNNNNYN